MSVPLAVLVVAQRGDPHADAVEAQLGEGRASFARTSLNQWSNQTIAWSANGSLALETESGAWTVEPETTVWWRRPGWFDSEVLGPEELELARDEAAVMLPGALEAVGVRWVDCPWRTARARNRLVQLSLARRLGIDIPETLVTNSSSAASRFMASGAAVAKAISTGPGLAPFVDRVDLADMELIANAPVLLQRVIESDTDWRVVTVGSTAFCWRRPRQPGEPLDWRAEDPAGERFRHEGHNDVLERRSTTIQERLGLSFSVQDWVEVDGVLYFLEVNAQGQWLFLDGAERVVSGALALHLSGGGTG